MSEIFNLGDLPAAWHRGNAAKRKRLQAWNFNWRFEPESRSVKTDSTGGRAHPGVEGDWPQKISAALVRGTQCLVYEGLIYVPAALGEPGHNELLGDICADAFGGADRKIPKYQARAAIRLGIIEVREGGRSQIAAYT